MTVNGRRPLLSVRDAAGYLSCSRDHVYDLIARGDLPAIDIGAGRALTRIRPEDLDDYVEKRTRQAPQVVTA